jgi:maltooligosyltrehalose synthase
VPLVPYFARLGISHLYASPLLAARAGSMHGYDVVDPTRSTRNWAANRRCAAWSAPCANTAWG